MIINEKDSVENTVVEDENRGGNLFSDRVERTGKVEWQSVELHRENPRFVYDIASGAGVFTSPDPLGHSITPDLYSYANGDPVNFVDPTGLAPNQQGATDPNVILQELRNLEAAGVQNPLDVMSNTHAGNTNRYFYTDEYGWVDVRHFFAAADAAGAIGSALTELGGFSSEVVQLTTQWSNDEKIALSP